MSALDRLETFDSREEWLAARRSGVGSSDAAAVLGLSTFRTPLALWSEKVGLVEGDDGESEWLAWGQRLEPAILRQLGAECGVAFGHFDLAIVRHRCWPALFASPDGLAFVGGEVVGGEVKNVSQWKADDWSDGVPAHVVAQVQHAMDCCEARRWYVGALIGGNRFVWDVVEYDAEWVVENRPALLDFARRVREEDAPEPGPDDARTLAAVHGDHEPGKVVSLGWEAWEATREIEAIEQSVARRKAAIDRRKNVIRAELGDAERGEFGDGSGWSWKTNKAGVRPLCRFKGDG